MALEYNYFVQYEVINYYLKIFPLCLISNNYFCEKLINGYQIFISLTRAISSCMFWLRLTE